jgi:hypothetical protein
VGLLRSTGAACGSGLTGRSTRTRSGIAPRAVRGSIRLAAECHCVPVTSNLRAQLDSARNHLVRLWRHLLRGSDCGSHALCETCHSSAQPIRCSEASRVHVRCIFSNLGLILVLANTGDFLDSHQSVWRSWNVRVVRFSILGSNWSNASGARLANAVFAANAELWQWFVELDCSQAMWARVPP